MRKAPKKILKIFKYFGYSIAGLLFLISAGSAFFLKTFWGRNYSASYISSFISSKTGTKVEIKGAYIGFREIILTDISIFDDHQKLLLSCDRASLIIKNLQRGGNKIIFNKLSVDHLIFKGLQYKNEKDLNFVIIIRRIQKQQKGGNGNPLKIVFKEIDVARSEFHFQRLGLTKKPGKIDLENFAVLNINSTLENFEIYNGHFGFKVKAFNGYEPQGLVLKSIKTNVEIDSTTMVFSTIDAITPNSHLKGNLAFSYNGYKDFQYFISKILMKGDLENSIINFSELSWFAKRINTNLKNTIISGNFTGTVDNLKCKEVKMEFGERSSFSGDVKFAGLPELSETMLIINSKKASFFFEDLEQLIPNVKIPANFFELGNVRFVGKYSGFINDFVAYGTVYTDLGNAKTDLNLKIQPGSKITSYSGSIAMEGFDLGRFLKQEKLFGKVNMTGSVNGKGFKMTDIDANFDIQASLLEFKKYPYQNLVFKGHLVKTDFNGGVIINDPNVNLDFNGNIDFSGTKPKFNYKAILRNANFYALNLMQDKFSLDCVMDINLEAASPNDATGNIKIRNAYLELSNSNFHFDSLTIFSSIAQQIKKIKIKSDFANIDLNGKFIITTLPTFLRQTLNNFLDTSFIIETNKKLQGQYLSFSIDLIKNDILNQFFKSKLYIADQTHLEGYLSYGSKNNIYINLPGIRYGNLMAKNWKMSVVSKDSQSLTMKAHIDKFILKDSTMAENIDISANSVQDSVMLGVSMINYKLKSLLNLNGTFKIKKDSVEFYLYDSKLRSNNIDWAIRSKKIIIRYKPEIDIDLLELKNETGSVKVLGSISDDKRKSLRILPDNLDLNDIIHFANNKKKFDFSGKLNGQILLYNILGYTFFDAAVVVSPLIYKNKDTLGILNIFTNFNERTNKNNIQVSLQNQDLDKLLSLDGDIDFSIKKDLDLKLYMPETDVAFFQPFIKGLFSNLKGTMKGEIAFTGNVSHPKVKGNFDFTNASLRIDYINTYYTFSDHLMVDEKSITATNIKLRDEYGKTAILNGIVKHDVFRNFYFNLSIDGNKIYALNTAETDNSIFYGQAFASGNVHIFGPLEKIKMDMQIKSEEHTRIVLTTYSTSSAGQYYYIRFTDRNDKFTSKQNVGPKGVILNINMEVTPEAEILLLFNPEMNDMVKGRGRGNIKFEMDNLGNMGMYGSYYLEQGEYLFSSMDVFKRKCSVTSGSLITWSGDPINAKIKIEATYKVDASVDDLLRESVTDNKNLNQKVPVLAKIFLTESLFSPEIKLGFDIVSTKSLTSNNLSSFDQKISYIKNDEQELNRQVIALLVMEKFLPVNFGVQAQNTINEGIYSNMGTLLSTQVSNLLSQFSSNFDSKYFSNIRVGVNYSVDSRLYQKEMEVIYGGSLLSGVVDVSGSYDIENLNNNFEASHLFKNSKIRFKVFSRTDNNPIYHENINRMGLGISFRKDFDSLSEFLSTKKNF